MNSGKNEGIGDASLRKGVYMAPTTIMINNVLNTLGEEDYNIAISFIQFLSDSRKKRSEQKKIEMYK